MKKKKQKQKERTPAYKIKTCSYGSSDEHEEEHNTKSGGVTAEHHSTQRNP